MSYRILHSTFWEDEFIEECAPDEKYFYLYLLTNANVNASGIYRLSPKVAAAHTGYSEEQVRKYIVFFARAGKIGVSDFSHELAIKSWTRYNSCISPSTRACIKKHLANVCDRKLISFVYKNVKGFEEFWEEGETRPPRCPVDTTEQEQEQEQDNISSANADSCRRAATVAGENTVDGRKRPEKTPEEAGQLTLDGMSGLPVADIDVAAAVELYHRLLPDAPRVRAVSTRRKAAFRQRLAEDKARRNPQWWQDYFAQVANCAWLKGENDRGFTADFEWLINGNNMLKTLEGRYARLGNARPAVKSGSVTELKLLAQQMAQRAGANLKSEI